MSLLDKIFKNQNESRTSFAPTEAFAAIAVSAIASDGFLSDEERQRIVLLLSELQLFSGYSEQRLRELLENLFNLLSVKGIDALVAVARESLPAELQESAFSVAIDLLLIDGVLSAKEETFLTHLWQIMDISAQTASEILDAKLEEHHPDYQEP
jgi:tellurite resistance protein